MSVIVGLSGAIGSGKTTFADYLLATEPSHARYESFLVVAEVADAFNQALKAELTFATTDDNLELINQALIWLPEIICDFLHFDTTWNNVAITQRERRLHPELSDKILTYLKTVRHNGALLGQPITAENKEEYRPLLQWLGGYLVAKISKTIWYDEIFRRVELRDNDKKLIVITGLRYPADAESVRRRSGIVTSITRPNAKLQDTHDITESQRHNIAADVQILNNGSLEDLARLAETFYSDCVVGAPKARYQALGK